MALELLSDPKHSEEPEAKKAAPRWILWTGIGFLIVALSWSLGRNSDASSKEQKQLQTALEDFRRKSDQQLSERTAKLEARVDSIAESIGELKTTMADLSKNQQNASAATKKLTDQLEILNYNMAKRN